MTKSPPTTVDAIRTLDKTGTPRTNIARALGISTIQRLPQPPTGPSNSAVQCADQQLLDLRLAFLKG